MASETKMFPIKPDFDLQEFTGKITQTYQTKGFTVTAIPMGTSGVSIDFRKDDGGIKKYVGLALGIKANITIQDSNMIVNFSDAEWTGKIVGLVVGWFLCCVPFICAIIGCFKQMEFPKTISNDIQLLVNQ